MQNQQHSGNLGRSSGSSISSSGLVVDTAVRSHLPPPPPTPPTSLHPARTTIGGRSPTIKSPVLSPPPAVVTVGGQTLIVPNSKLARKVMGNETPTSGLEIRLGASGSLSRQVVPSVVDDRQNQSSRPLSNLSVLLSQQNTAVAREDSQQEVSNVRLGVNSEHEQSSSSSSAARNQADEADSASGPPPTLVQAFLGRSAPDVGSGRRAGPVAAPPPPAPVSQYSRFRSTPTLPSTDIVRR
jgi:hypothetical protein